MYFERFYEKGLAQASYMVGCQASGEALVVDPLRDVDGYLRAASREGLRITRVTETHVHADFVSGARQLAQDAGAELLLSEEGGPDWRARFDHTPLHDGDLIELGEVLVEVLHTPGHTPEHLSFLVTDKAVGKEPVMVLTGDFLFVGDVGRPDLLESAAGIAGSAESGARRLFASTRRILKLPDYVQIWPGHGAGSACGKALGALPSTTVGYERRFNWALREDSEERFVRTALAGQPEVPSYFARMKQINLDGSAPFDPASPVPRLDRDTLADHLRSGNRIVDARSVKEFSRGHLPGALNIPDDGSFVTWAGWLLDPASPLVLVAEPAAVDELQRALVRVGVDRLAGCYCDLSEWERAGGRLVGMSLLPAREFEKRRPEFAGRILDVRSREEFERGHIPRALHIHLGRLAGALDGFDRGDEVMVYCESGGRSAVAASLLVAHGIERVTNLADGFAAWRAMADAPIETATKETRQNERA